MEMCLFRIIISFCFSFADVPIFKFGKCPGFTVLLRIIWKTIDIDFRSEALC